MKNQSPHIIIIKGSMQYPLSELQENQILYDFDKMLIYLNSKGKLLFGKNFRIYTEDREILLKFCNYFIKDEANCKKLNIDPTKGILLTEPVGCGNVKLYIIVAKPV